MYSNYSFLDRWIHTIWLWAFFLMCIWNADRFASFNPIGLFQRDLTTLVSYFFVIGLSTSAVYDSAYIWISYSVGYIVNPDTNNIIPRPLNLYDPEYRVWVRPCIYILMVSFSMQACVFLLVQYFYNYMTSAVAKMAFISKLEFRIYVITSILFITSFPIAQMLTKTISIPKNMPQFLFSIFILCLSALSCRAHVKFRNFINIIQLQMDGSEKDLTAGFVLAKLQYFQEMNKILMISQFLIGISFGILNVGSHINPEGSIAESKFASDLLIGFTNFSTAIAWMIAILIFYPRKGFIDKVMKSKKNTIVSEERNEVGDSLPVPFDSSRRPSVTHAWFDEEEDGLGQALLDEKSPSNNLKIPHENTVIPALFIEPLPQIATISDGLYFSDSAGDSSVNSSRKGSAAESVQNHLLTPSSFWSSGRHSRLDSRTSVSSGEDLLPPSPLYMDSPGEDKLKVPLNMNFSSNTMSKNQDTINWTDRYPNFQPNLPITGTSRSSNNSPKLFESDALDETWDFVQQPPLAVTLQKASVNSNSSLEDLKLSEGLIDPFSSKFATKFMQSPSLSKSRIHSPFSSISEILSDDEKEATQRDHQHSEIVPHKITLV